MESSCETKFSSLLCIQVLLRSTKRSTIELVVTFRPNVSIAVTIVHFFTLSEQNTRMIGDTVFSIRNFV